MGRSFSGLAHPFYLLGTFAFYFFYIIVVTGIYLFIFYDPSVKGSYDTVEYLTREQWYLGGVMRSLHRYASGGLVLTMVLHIVREFFWGRYRGARWYSWLTGVLPFLLVFPSGLVGYWLVWDKLAQLIAVRTTEWIDWLPIFSEPSARNFLTNDSITDLFFRLILIAHIVMSVFLVVALLIHVKKISKARAVPPLGTALGSLLALLVLSLAVPALSHERADLSIAPTTLNIDWFYMFIYPLMERWSMGGVWAFVAGITLLLLILPWLPPKRPEPAAKVHLAKCSGCGLCVWDCPYEAITMEWRSDGHPLYSREAVVTAEDCVSCGICAGSCPSSRPSPQSESLVTGIDLPHRDVQQLYAATRDALRGLTTGTKVLIYGCDHGIDMSRLSIPGTATLSLPCTAALPPSFISYALRHGADGVFLTGCRMGDCYNRLGNVWVEQRISLEHMRRPNVPRWVPRERLGWFWAAPGDERRLRRAVDAFRRELAKAAAEKGHTTHEKKH